MRSGPELDLCHVQKLVKIHVLTQTLPDYNPQQLVALSKEISQDLGRTAALMSQFDVYCPVHRCQSGGACWLGCKIAAGRVPVSPAPP